MVFCLRHNALYLGGHSAQTVHPLSKLAYKRHILGMSTSPRKWFLSPEIVTFELCAGSKHRTQNTASGSSFLRLAKPLRRNLEIFHRCMLRHIDSRLLFQTSSTSVQDKCPKGRIVLVTEKNTSWHRLAESLGRFPTTSYASVHCGPTLLFLIAYKSVQVWGSYNRKTLLRPLKWIFK